MKAITSVLITIFVLSGFAIAEDSSGPANPYVIHGDTLIGNEPAKAMKIKFNNLDTGASGEFISTSAGEYGFQINPPNSQTQTIELEYCIDDTRCNQNTITFTITGQGNHRYDINAPYNPIGSCGSYPVYGSVIVDSQTITSGTMNIKNLDTGNSIDTEIKSDGYQDNLANINGCYETGDDIRFTYGSYTDDIVIVGNGGMEFNFVYTTPVTPPDGGGDNGEGGGGGDGGSGPDQQQGTPPEEPETPEEPTQPTPTEPDEVPEEMEGGDEGPDVIDIDTEGKGWIWILIIVIIIAGAVAYFVFKKK